MCLRIVTKIYDPSKSGIKQGYKVVNKAGCTPLYWVKISKGWMEAQNLGCGKYLSMPLYAEDGIAYPPGFHIFPKKADAKEFLKNVNNGKIINVEYDQVVAEGLGDGYSDNDSKNVVAKKIRLAAKSKSKSKK